MSDIQDKIIETSNSPVPVSDYTNNKQARRYCITINNPEETDEEMMEFLKGLEHIKYFIFSREKGEKEC